MSSFQKRLNANNGAWNTKTGTPILVGEAKKVEHQWNKGTFSFRFQMLPEIELSGNRMKLNCLKSKLVRISDIHCTFFCNDQEEPLGRVFLVRPITVKHQNPD